MVKSYELLEYMGVSLDIDEEEDLPVRLLVVTSANEKSEDKLFRTAAEIKKIAEKKNLEHYILFIEDANVERDKDGDYKVFNLEDKKGFEIGVGTAVIVRGSVARSKLSLDLLSQIEMSGAFLINFRESLEFASDKYRTCLILRDAGLPQPKTHLLTEENLTKALSYVGEKFPLVVKTLSGSKGVGVFFIETKRSMKAILDTVWKLNDEAELLVQEFIPIDKDIRVHILGGKVIAAMERVLPPDDLRANFSQDATVKPVKLTSEEEELAVSAANALGCSWAGVDIIRSTDKKNYVIEVNSSPGTEGIELATGKSIVSEIINFALDQSNHRRKTVTAGVFEVVELDGVGKIVGKMDTGNSSMSVLHSEEYEVKNGKVFWLHEGKTYSHKLQGYKKVKVGGLRDYTERRPIIKFDVRFNKRLLKDVKFTLDDRSDRSPILLSRGFIKKAGLSIDPARKYVLSNKEDATTGEEDE